MDALSFTLGVLCGLFVAWLFKPDAPAPKAEKPPEAAAEEDSEYWWNGGKPPAGDD